MWCFFHHRKFVKVSLYAFSLDHSKILSRIIWKIKSSLHNSLDCTAMPPDGYLWLHIKWHLIGPYLKYRQDQDFSETKMIADVPLARKG